MIPEPLSGVAASMIAAHDRINREREDFMEWRAGEIRRLKIWQWVGVVTIAAAVVSLIASFGAR